MSPTWTGGPIYLENTMGIAAKIEGSNLVLTIPLEDPPQRSASGKSLVIASTRGNAVTSLMVQGKPLTVGCNAYIKP